MLGLSVTVGPRTFRPRASQLVQLVCRRVDTATGSRVVVAVQALPVQLECAVSSSGGVDRLCDPAFRIGNHLLVNPLLQARLVSRGPAAATQGLACEVILRVLLDLGHSLVVEVRANDLQASGRNILTAKGTHSVVVQSTLQNVEVPESLTSINAVVIVAALVLSPLVLWQVLRQLVLLGVLDGHTRDLVAAPLAITLSRRSGVSADAREDTSRWLVHQTILVRHVSRKFRPDADLLALMVSLPDGLTNRCISLEGTRYAARVGVRRHIDGEVAVFIRFDVVHR